MALDMFIKIGDIKGESTDAHHKDEIQVLAWNWGMSQSGTTHQGSGRGAGGKASFQDLSFTHLVDKASPKLMLACASDQREPEAVLTVRKTGTRPLEFVKITMNDVIVASVTTGTNANEDRLTENVSLNFAKFKVTYTAQKPDGSGDTPITIGWDIAGNVKTI